MDPITAALEAFRAFNDFLCTPAGQQLATANNALIQTILTKLHLRVAADAAPAK